MLHEYTSDDEDQVVEMIIQFYNHLADSAQVERWIDQKTALKTLSDWVDDDLVYTHKEAGDVLALARLREDHGTFWVEDLVVREDRRGKGIGSKVLGYIEKMVQGAKALFLDIVPSNLPSLDFYLKNGYKYLNTIELRKNFYETPSKAKVDFLGRSLEVHSWPKTRPLPTTTTADDDEDRQ